MKNSSKEVLFTLVLVVGSLVSSYAQPGCAPCPPGWTCVAGSCEPPPSSAEVPIDGGVLGLLVVGAIYGAKKIYDRKKAI